MIALHTMTTFRGGAKYLRLFPPLCSYSMYYHMVAAVDKSSRKLSYPSFTLVRSEMDGSGHNEKTSPVRYLVQSLTVPDGEGQEFAFAITPHLDQHNSRQEPLEPLLLKSRDHFYLPIQNSNTAHTQPVSPVLPGKSGWRGIAGFHETISKTPLLL
jgi:hypothetical protein